MKTGKVTNVLILSMLVLGPCNHASAELSTCITAPISSTPILPHTDFQELNCLATISLAGTTNEYVAASVTINSTVSIPDLTIHIESLTGPDGTIAASVIDVRYVKVWYQSGSAWQTTLQDNSKKVLVPELLLHNSSLIKVDETSQKNFLVISGNKLIDINSVTQKSSPDIVPVDRYPIHDSKNVAPLALPASTNQQLWITLHLPGSTPPGQYQGRIRITSIRAKLQHSIPLTVTVYPFDLLAPELIYSIYYRGTLTANNTGSISSETKSVAQMRAELANLREHGITNPTVYQPPQPLSLLDQVMTLRSAAGLDNSTFYYYGIRTEHPDDLAYLNRNIASLKRLQPLAAKHGVKKILVYGIDEAEPALIPKQKYAWAKYKQMGADVFVADWRPGAERHYAGQLSTIVLGAQPDARANDFLRANGTKVFLYNRPQVGVEDPYVYRLNYGLGAWRMGFDGVMNYAYQASMGDIWNDFDHPTFRDHAFTYPTSDGIVDTLAWEGFREAVVDVKYISTLKKLAELSHSKQDQQYIALLKNMGAQDLDAMRRDIARRIAALCGTFERGASFEICKPVTITRGARLIATGDRAPSGRP